MVALARAVGLVSLALLLAHPLHAQTPPPPPPVQPPSPAPPPRPSEPDTAQQDDDRGRVAVGIWVGAAVPTEKMLETNPQLAISIDAHLARDLSLRGEFGASSMGLDPFGYRRGLQRQFVNVNGVYQRTFGRWHPFVTAGIGLYRTTGTIDSAVLADPVLRAELIALGLDPMGLDTRDHDNEPGGNVGGGVELVLSPRLTIGGDFRYHAVGNVMRVLPLSGSFYTLSAGIKRYF